MHKHLKLLRRLRICGLTKKLNFPNFLINAVDLFLLLKLKEIKDAFLSSKLSFCGHELLIEYSCYCPY